MKSLIEYINQLKEYELFCDLTNNCKQTLDYNQLSQTEITGITANTKSIFADNIFVCIKGFTVDGHDLANEAIHKGAIAIVVEHELDLDNVYQIIVKNSRKALSILTKYYYDNPADSFKLIGITGTNGKTTSAWLVMQILIGKGFKVGMIGTLGYYINGKKYESERTTPDIIELNQIFVQMREEKVDYVVMEVSSHAITLNRVYGLKFHITAFTNLTQDHLDFHKDMDDYATTKLKLFTEMQDNQGFSVINIDDEFGQIIAEQCPVTKKLISLDSSKLKKFDQLYFADDINFNIQKTSFNLYNSKSAKTRFETSLVGEFNVLNCITAIAITDEIPDNNNKSMKEIVAQLTSAKGRLEQVPNDLSIGIFIDYAHTPDAVKNVLKTLSFGAHNRIITLIGAGGNRDKSKRPLMSKTALQYSDLVILCDDNPRDEIPANIINDMLTGIEKDTKLLIIRDRKVAITAALLLAKENDIILIAGKGHETYQEINGHKHPFNEYSIVNTALSTIVQEKAKNDKLVTNLDIMNLSLCFNHRFNKDSLVKFNYFNQVITDSRQAQEHSLFIAIKGDNFDGGDYCEQVLQKENTFCIVNNDYHDLNHLLNKYDDRIIVVDDTIKAYGFLAKKYLALFAVKKIALTGSTGKTTTKAYLSNILSQKYHILTNFANENNLIGVPKTIFNLRAYHDIALLELGTNQFGEIKQLAEIIEPDIGLIINIGPAHLEKLKNEDGVFQEKSELFNYTKDTIIYPCNDKKFDIFKSFGIKSFCVGMEDNAHYKLEIQNISNNKISFSVNNEPYLLNENILFKVQNATFAIAVAKELSMKQNEIQRGLIKPLNINHRMEIMEINGSTWLVDCYNANPVSMQSAIEYWISYQNDKEHFAILGDMLELGENKQKYHQDIQKTINKYSINKNIFSVGKISKDYNANRHFETVEDLINSKVIEKIPTGSIVLVKASNGIKLKKLIER
ncbi:MAG: UDP-N-acetylmuramoyl-L-alanyl-D-glutamate--2,6-diaminopimelate ligase [Candidatus Cloacimonadales bacterium]|jgi:UDP-N-acetylmuramyl-tripeptide synthetase/UDP-N-acetylmuramoyl-tripeptide--D-alanyl-D-alanine ligase|nr:UDP-N-acetylmuramoyl-L-alanyl-D-glutamate--2,6-diaminopimelate ligase [Candidatus Cloacimonadota bacterium]MDX9976895.1 UDP-N-acetylmuramoyl-L-alanyl-D-glutamate--2,6-diaminopimelate ligase [Candidatus Cloacimonadales bacterium]